MKTLRIALFPVALGLAAAVGIGSLNAAAATGRVASSSSGWHVGSPLPVTGSAGGVTAAGPHAEWVFGSSDLATKPGTAWEDTGGGWHQVRFAAAPNEWVSLATALSPNDAWAFSQKGTSSRAWHWNGRSWSVVRSFPVPVSGAIVLSANDIWVSGYQAGQLGTSLTWHFNGHQWSQVAASGLTASSASSPGNVWAYGGADVAKWTGHGWARTSLAKFLPPVKQGMNDPRIDAIVALSPSSVYALADANGQDSSGPWSLLHDNGHSWSRVSKQLAGTSTGLVPDGHGGLWISVSPGCCGLGVIDHYAHGTVSTVSLPASVDVGQIAAVPDTSQFLAAATERPSANDFANQHPVVLQYQS
ncbi:MAG TPA: hypothetical protein VGG16_27455 [Streptosporangiaceae bacterium]